METFFDKSSGSEKVPEEFGGRVDLILYPQFRFRNSRLDVMYEVQINLNPTLEVNLWRGSKLTAQRSFRS